MDPVGPFEVWVIEFRNFDMKGFVLNEVFLSQRLAEAHAADSRDETRTPMWRPEYRVRRYVPDVDLDPVPTPVPEVVPVADAGVTVAEVTMRLKEVTIKEWILSCPWIRREP